VKLLSLFDGSGAFCLAAERLGIKARYASEIEPFPIAVTRARFPDTEHLGDIMKINGGEIEPCDIVTFGSPCTSWSIAGKQSGLSGQSGLFFQAIRVMREMLTATNGSHPRMFLFENVPNLLSINQGTDWKIVMDAFADLGFICDPDIQDSQEHGIAQRRKRIFIVGINRKYYNPDYFADIPNARAKRMQKAIDTWGGETFHGIASRPHEIYRQHLSEILERDADPKYYLSVAACLGILRRIDAKGKEIPQLLRSALEYQAGLFNSGNEDDEILSFEPGATARLPKGKHWNGIAPTLRADSGDNHVSVAFEAGSMIRRKGGTWEDISPTLRAEAHGGDNHPGVAIPIDMRNALRTGGEQGAGVRKNGDAAYTVTAEYQGAIAVENYPSDGRVKLDESGTVQTLTRRCGSGGNNVPLCAEPVVYGISSVASHAMCSQNPHSGVYETDTAKTLDTSAQTPCNQGGLVVCVQGAVVGRKNKNGPKGKGVQDNLSYTIDTHDAPAVAYAMTTGSFAQTCEEQSPTLMARDFKNPPVINQPAFALDRAAYNQSLKALYKPQIGIETTHSLTARGPGAVSAPPEYIVRRLTPTECLVLMNLPRNWCEGISIENPTEEDYIFWEGVFSTLGKKKSRKQIARFLAKPYSDGACYKMAGNGVVTAVAQWVLEGVVDYARFMGL